MNHRKLRIAWSVVLLGVLGILIALLIARWAGWRFSLRTSPIAMTLVAVGLGLIVWAHQII